MRTFKEANVNLNLDKIPEGKKYLDILDNVAGMDNIDNEQDANYQEICDIIINKKSLTQRDVEKIVNLSKTISPKLAKAAEKLKAVLTESRKRFSENVATPLPVKLQFKSGKSIYLDYNEIDDFLDFKVIWYEETEDGEMIPTFDTVTVQINPFESGKIRILNNKMQESQNSFVNNFKKSLGNYLVKHQKELSACRTKQDLINLLSSALGNGNDDYINSVIENLKGLTDTKALKYIYNIVLAGYGDRVN